MTTTNPLLLSALLTSSFALSAAAGTSTVYLSATTGDDLNPGTQSEPVATFERALSLLDQFDDIEDTIYLASGTYTADAHWIISRDALRLHGSYDPFTWTRDQTTPPTTLESTNASLSKTDPAGLTIDFAISAPRFVLDRITIIAPDAPSNTSGSSIGLHIINAPDEFLIYESEIFAGAGGSGAPGTPWTTHAADGSRGQRGHQGCEDGATFCDHCSRPLGGSGAPSSWGSQGGRGGDGGHRTFPGSPGFSGSCTDNPALQGPGGTGTPPSLGNTCSVEDSYGQNGLRGLEGAMGSGASSFIFPEIPTIAAAGERGQHGGGGGGGSFGCSTYGGGGGGGGSGGQGGQGGRPGSSGGSSIALFIDVTASSNFLVLDSTITSAPGGNGGEGSLGQNGGIGGQGGGCSLYGGSGQQDDGTNGQYGGRGGAGGRGGPGGGGAGGASIALHNLSNITVHTRALNVIFAQPGTPATNGQDGINTPTTGSIDTNPVFDDCNANDIPDIIDIANGILDSDDNTIPDLCECPADLNGDNTYDASDITQLLMSELDYNGDTQFDFFDISSILQDLSSGCP